MTPSQRGRSRCGQIARTASRVVHAADARGSVPKRQGARQQGCVLFHLSSQHQVTRNVCVRGYCLLVRARSGHHGAKIVRDRGDDKGGQRR